MLAVLHTTSQPKQNELYSILVDLFARNKRNPCYSMISELPKTFKTRKHIMKNKPVEKEEIAEGFILFKRLLVCHITKWSSLQYSPSSDFYLRLDFAFCNTHTKLIQGNNIKLFKCAQLLSSISYQVEISLCRTTCSTIRFGGSRRDVVVPN